MKLVATLILTGALVSASAARAQSPTTAPAGATGICRDGTFWTGPTKRGACHGHQGVKEWYAGATSATTPTAPAMPTPAPRAGPPPAPAGSSSPPAASMPARTSQVSGAAPGQVWVNTHSNVYHCSTDRWYGKTKEGAYMSESDAVAKGARPDHGKACH